MKNIQPKVINLSKDPSFLCMLNDAKLLENLMEQKVKGSWEGTDYIPPNIINGQSTISVYREILKSISNHLDHFEKENIFLL